MASIEEENNTLQIWQMSKESYYDDLKELDKMKQKKGEVKSSFNS